MTAILGILNKTAVALAADSATTHTGGRGEKIYNNAHKLFNISNHYPVGMMVCNSAELTGIPWEIIIKMYRKQLVDFKFDYLPDYGKNFAEYLQNSISGLLDDKDKALAVLRLSTDIANHVIQKLGESWQSDPPPAEIDLNELANEVLRANFLPEILTNFSEKELIDRVVPYSFDNFNDEYGEIIKKNLSAWVRETSGIDIKLNDETLDSMLSVVYAYSQHQVEFDSTGSWSGVVLAGFGEKDIFPQLVSYRIGPVFNGEVRIVKEREAKISSQKPSSIEPFAQSDVIQTFWEGMDPFIIDTVAESMAGVVDHVVDHVIEVLPEGDKEKVQQWLRDSRPGILKDLNNSMKQVIETKNRKPMLDAIATLSKEDLADMAESLISLTYLKRRASFSSESVGGPVDVAVITKGEGFIWLKRKQYFRPELNLNYISSVITRTAHPTS
ncbi:MAG: hypothetical protein ACRYFZ_00825 [Janthinobacterium lividum]